MTEFQTKEEMKMSENRTVSFEILQQVGVLSTSGTGWSKEVNLVSWNGSAPKYDIREWDPAHERMSRGVTLNEREMARMMDAIMEKKPQIKAVMAREANRDEQLER